MSCTHFKKVCKECEGVIRQCRCPAEKTVEYTTCDACKIKAYNEAAVCSHSWVPLSGLIQDSTKMICEKCETLKDS